MSKKEGDDGLGEEIGNGAIEHPANRAHPIM